jgi:hypothetical protein
MRVRKCCRVAEPGEGGLCINRGMKKKEDEKKTKKAREDKYLHEKRIVSRGKVFLKCDLFQSFSIRRDQKFKLSHRGRKKWSKVRKDGEENVWKNL